MPGLEHETIGLWYPAVRHQRGGEPHSAFRESSEIRRSPAISIENSNSTLRAIRNSQSIPGAKLGDAHASQRRQTVPDNARAHQGATPELKVIPEKCPPRTSRRRGDEGRRRGREVRRQVRRGRKLPHDGVARALAHETVLRGGRGPRPRRARLLLVRQERRRQKALARAPTPRHSRKMMRDGLVYE